MSTIATHDARQHVTMMIGNVPVDLCSEQTVLEAVRGRLVHRHGAPLAIGSVNLDHLHHFAADDRRRLDYPAEHGEDGVDWLLLADGAPIVARADRLTGTTWPRLTGADLLPAILAVAEISQSSVGFVGGYAELHAQLRVAMAKRYPALPAPQFWAPERREVLDPRRSRKLAEEIAEGGVDLLVVGLGKPQQELWIEHFGTVTAARAILAFGAASDFLAGNARRAPEAMQRTGLEWLYRLKTEPRRLARRYLIEGPPELLTLRQARVVSDFRSAITDVAPALPETTERHPAVRLQSSPPPSNR